MLIDTEDYCSMGAGPSAAEAGVASAAAGVSVWPLAFGSFLQYITFLIFQNNKYGSKIKNMFIYAHCVLRKYVHIICLYNLPP